MVSFATEWLFNADHHESEATKSLSGRRALHYDKHQFCAKMMVSTETVFELSLLNIVV